MGAMFIYKAMRHYAPVEDGYETFTDAAIRACADRDSGEACPLEIADESGKTIYGGERLYAYLDTFEHCGRAVRYCTLACLSILYFPVVTSLWLSKELIVRSIYECAHALKSMASLAPETTTEA